MGHPAFSCDFTSFAYRVTHQVRRTKPIVDMRREVVFYDKGLILKRNFCFDVNGRFAST